MRGLQSYSPAYGSDQRGGDDLRSRKHGNGTESRRLAAFPEPAPRFVSTPILTLMLIDFLMLCSRAANLSAGSKDAARVGFTWWILDVAFAPLHVDVRSVI